MPYAYTRNRKDNTHKEVGRALDAAGFSIQDISGVGGGCGDWLAAKHNVTLVVEAKDEGEEPRPNQVEWADNWQGLYVWGDDPQAIVNECQEKVMLYE